VFTTTKFNLIFNIITINDKRYNCNIILFILAGTKHWEKVKKGNANIKPWEKRNGVAEDIEMTSYALLTLANKNDSTDPSGVQVLKWVTEQRNPNGGFSSTQVRTIGESEDFLK
jgi:hypothetical protein